MKVSIALSLIGTVAMIKAAPQFGFENNQPPQPYNFAYGVNNPETGDVKEHKEIVTPSGVTEGEYRWLQPNGLYRVTRYTADGASGFRALVSEEPGPEVPNYYVNSLFGSTPSQTLGNFVSGNSGFSSSQSFQNQGIGGSQSFQNQNFGSFQNQPVGVTQSFQNQPVGVTQSFQTPVLGGLLPLQDQSFTSSPNPQNSGFSISSNQGFDNIQFVDFRNPSTVSSQNLNSFTDGGIIDGGIISGNIIDGGIISGGNIDGRIISGDIIDGGIIDNSNSNFGVSFSQQPISSNFNNFESTSSNFNDFGSVSGNFNNFGSTSNTFGSGRITSNNANRGVSVVLGGRVNRIQG